MAYAHLFPGYGPQAPVDALGEWSPTAAGLLKAYRGYLIAYRSALSAAQTDAQREYAAGLLSQANSYKSQYLALGANDLTATDRAILSIASSASLSGKALDNVIEWAASKAGNVAKKVTFPLIPIALLAVAGLYFWSKRGR